MLVLSVNVHHTDQKQVVALATCKLGKFILGVRLEILFFFLNR